MSYFISHRYKGDESEVSVDKFPDLFDELTFEDDEHPSVSVTHESAWCLSAYKNGLLIWENVEEEGEPRHMTDVSKIKVIELWQKLAQGDIEAIEQEDWFPGYG